MIEGVLTWSGKKKAAIQNCSEEVGERGRSEEEGTSQLLVTEQFSVRYLEAQSCPIEKEHNSSLAGSEEHNNRNFIFSASSYCAWSYT